MSIFAPEQKEYIEKSYEGREFSRKIERDLLRALDQNKESFSDIVACPNPSCRTPVKVNIKKAKNEVELFCSNCGWQRVIKQGKNE